MTKEEWQFWSEERVRVELQLRGAMEGYAETIQKVRAGAITGPDAQSAITATLDSLELCRKQVVWTRDKILDNLGLPQDP